MSLTREQVASILNAVTSGKMDMTEAERCLFIGSYPDALEQPATRTVVAYIAVNEEGNVEASDERDNAVERLGESHGGYEAEVIRVVVTLPRRKEYEAAVIVTADQVRTVTIEADNEE